jgi:hypothetical protein
MTAITAGRAAGLASAAGFRPYVYGAASGRPSRGRPGLVLAAGLVPETTVRRLERELGAGISGPPVTNGRPRRQGCGTPAGARRHYRDEEKPCEACRPAANRDAAAHGAERRARSAPVPAAPVPPPVPAASVPVAEVPVAGVPGRLPRCPDCGYLRDALGHIWACRRRG